MTALFTGNLGQDWSRHRLATYPAEEIISRGHREILFAVRFHRKPHFLSNTIELFRRIDGYRSIDFLTHSRNSAAKYVSIEKGLEIDVVLTAYRKARKNGYGE